LRERGRMKKLAGIQEGNDKGGGGKKREFYGAVVRNRGGLGRGFRIVAN